MSRGKQKPYIEKPFYGLTEKMVKSKAWAELDSYDKEAFLHIAIKCKGEENKHDLSLTYEEAKKFGQSAHRFKDSIDHLVEYGFIDIVKSGGVWKKCNIYGLSERWRGYGSKNYKEGKRVVSNPNFNPMALAEN